MSQPQIEYVNLHNTFSSDFVSTNTAIFNNRTIVQQPAGFGAGDERFQLYINGMHIPPLVYTIQQVGSDVSAVIQTGQTEYTLDSGDEVILSGKIQ
jgi:hypothetical protein